MAELLTTEDRKALFEAGDHHPDHCDCTPFADEVDYLPQGTEMCEGFEDTLTAVETIVHRAVADELRRQADAIRQRIRTHGVGMRHGCDAGRSNYCEAWRLILADIEARARSLASPTVTTQHDTTNEENPC